MKKTPIFTILCIAVLAAAVLYFAGQAVKYFSDPLTTTPVYEAKTQDSIPLTGYLVRQEETFHSSNGTLVHYQTEGARVGVGQTLAVSYPNEEALQTVARVEELEMRLEQLEFALNSYLDPDAALQLDSSITQSVIRMHQEISDGNYADGYSEIAALESAVMKRSYSYSSVDEIEADIARAKQEMASEKAGLSGARPIAAPYCGTYSAICDGYETVLTPEWLETVTPRALDAVRPVESEANVGKLISGDTWYYAAAISAQQAEQLKGRTSVTVRFSKGLTQDLSMTIQQITAEEDGKCVLILKSSRYLAQTTTLRHQAAELILREYSGLRVPANALRVSEDGVAGVYCVAGVTARFKPVQVLWQGEGHALVKASDDAAGATILRVGDEVIATSGELHDGKVIG